MKLKNVIALVTVAAAAAMPLSAQQPAQPLSLTVLAQMKKGSKLLQLQLLPPANVEKNVVLVREMPTKMNPEPEVQQMKTSAFKVLVVQSPADFLTASRLYNADNLKEARTQLKKVREKYAAFDGVSGSPSLKAARMELDCLVRLMDWDGVNELLEAAPGRKFMEAEDRIVQSAARLVARVSDDASTAAARQKEIEAFLADSKSKAVSSDVYGWVKYALGRAIASNITPEELQNGISEANARTASLAVDAYCEAVASNHWRNSELPVDALKRAFNILWAMPGVKSYSLVAKQMDEQRWNAAPHNFRDAVAIAYLLENVYAPGQVKDSNVQKAAALFYNKLQGKDNK